MDGLAELNAAAESLWSALHVDHPGLTLEVLPTVASTNSHALQLGRLGADAPVVVVAWEQSAGRGRAGRTWEARPGDALTLSVGLPMALNDVPGGGSALSLAVGVAVAEALEALTAPQGASAGATIALKWPNDLWVNDRKLGGVLIEVISGAALPPEQRWVVIGLGVNLASTQPEMRAERCDLAELMGEPPQPVSPAQAMLVLVPRLLHAAQTFQHEGFEPLQSRFTARDALRGRSISLWRTTHLPAGQAQAAQVQGTAVGVTAQGALLLDDGQGAVQPWSIGEVSVRPRP